MSGGKDGAMRGRLAKRAYRPGDQVPAVGSLCLVSGVNCDIESDQSRAYSWRTVVGYSEGRAFVCLQTKGCWPTVERLENCWFAEIPTPLESDSTALASAIKERDEAYARVEVLEEEMRRYLPLLEFAEELPVWYAMTKGTGIATLNSYRAALSPELAKEPQS